MTLTDDSSTRHWHDPACGHCPRCGADLPPAPYNTYCSATTPPHWTQDEEWDIPENRPEVEAVPADAPNRGPGDVAPGDVTETLGRFVYEVGFPDGSAIILQPGGQREMLGRHVPALAGYVHVSERHAEVWVDADGDFYVRDVGTNGTGSRNGTFIDGVALNPGIEARVNPGARVLLAKKVELAFRSVKAHS